MLGKNNEFTSATTGGIHLGLVLQQMGKLFPFFVVARLHHSHCLVFQVFQDDDFGFQFRNGFGGSGLINHLIDHHFVLFSAQLFIHLIDVVRHINLFGDLIFAQGFRHAIPASLFKPFAPCNQLHFVQTGFQALTAAFQRLVNGFGARSQAALELSEGKANSAFTLTVKIVRTVHFVADVVGHFGIKLGFGIGQLIVGGIGPAFWEERSTIELQQLFLDHTTHHVGDIDLMCAFSEFAVEAVTIQQREPDLEVFFLAVVGRCGHQ